MLVGGRGISAAAGFTLLQLLATIVILGTLAAMAMPAWEGYLDKARKTRAIAQIAQIEVAINSFAINSGGLPASLADVGHSAAVDPWGGAIIYLDLSLGGSPRVDQNGVAVNTDYDLYSIGPDQATALSLIAGSSDDDIVRASNGGFVGCAVDYSRLN